MSISINRILFSFAIRRVLLLYSHFMMPVQMEKCVFKIQKSRFAKLAFMHLNSYLKMELSAWLTEPQLHVYQRKALTCREMCLWAFSRRIRWEDWYHPRNLKTGNREQPAWLCLKVQRSASQDHWQSPTMKLSSTYPQYMLPVFIPSLLVLASRWTDGFDSVIILPI